MKSPASHLPTRLRQACRQVRSELLAERGDQGHWVGELSSSALATATAISALSQYRHHSLWPVLAESRVDELIDKGCHWLLAQQNSDGGWGDTDQSHSNVATTMLAVAALTLAGHAQQPISAVAIASANGYIDGLGRVAALKKRYGKDKTFAVPILANCAIAGLVSWKQVAALPFEAVLVPQKFYRFVQLPVVSYAIPALVAIGMVKHFKDPPWNPIPWLARKSAVQRGLSELARMQPRSGGYLEAIPLTCFVAMSLAHCGHADHEVVQNCIQFIDRSFRDLPDQGGTWAIDTNLATWNTTLAINALGRVSPGGDDANENGHLTDQLLEWLLQCQYQEPHPFTGAKPGGWGWSNLSGAVPDADDTPGAMLALTQWSLDPGTETAKANRIRKAAAQGTDWLLDLQNRDHGWPTFCRGWGRLPFDRSGNDITAHVIRALLAWHNRVDDTRTTAAVERGFRFLQKKQNADGSWHPLWFGNQDHAAEENPVYGTVKVLLAYLDAKKIGQPESRRAITLVVGPAE